MPDIETHGPANLPFESVLDGAAYLDKLSFTRVTNRVETLGGFERPTFVRVVASHQFSENNLDDLMRRLSMLHADIEFVRMERFVHAR
jgi:hypothetical protein